MFDMFDHGSIHQWGGLTEIGVPHFIIHLPSGDLT
jgi:hypothetical protein